MDHSLFHRQEVYRAQAVIEKARKAGDNVGQALRDHMVSPSAVAELGIEREEYKPRAKRGSSEDKVLDWARANVGATTNPDTVAKTIGVSYPTANKVFQARADWFHKIKKGVYTVRDADAERKAAKEEK